MSQEFYLATQLPDLRWATTPPITVDSFMEEAAKWLSATELQALRTADLNLWTQEPDSKLPKFLSDLIGHERAVREDGASWVAGKSPKTLAIRLLEGNPLEVEKALLRERWDFLETILGTNYADLEYFMVYKMKIQILDRLSQFDQQKGRVKFEQLSRLPPEVHYG